MRSFLILISFSVATCFCQIVYGADTPSFYQIKVYHMKDEAQEKAVENFLKMSYLPAMHKAGISTVGVFKPVEPDSVGRLLYVFIPFSSFEQFVGIDSVLERDKQYQKNGASYLNAPHDDPPYTRIESILLKPFSGMKAPEIPQLKSPKNDRIYELRSYESATENYFHNKVKMFNAGNEIGIFSRLNFNAVFYGEVLSGPRMPNLMYMTAFNNKEDRDQHWEAFGKDADWQELKELPEYQNNVSKADIHLLHPTEYSDF